jgi:hypothetical protein
MDSSLLWRMDCRKNSKCNLKRIINFNFPLFPKNQQNNSNNPPKSMPQNLKEKSDPLHLSPLILLSLPNKRYNGLKTTQTIAISFCKRNYSKRQATTVNSHFMSMRNLQESIMNIFIVITIKFILIRKITLVNCFIIWGSVIF